jgi:RNA polymerase sigma factor (sigma-70 family)
METSGFRDMVRDAQGGNPQSREELFRRARPLVERLAQRRPRRPGESINELVQMVCERMLVKLDQFRGAADAPDDDQAWALFGGWARQIVFSVGANVIRDQDPLPKTPLTPQTGSTATGANDPPAQGPGPATVVRKEDEFQKVREALERLPDETNREIVRLRFFEGLSLREITVRLDPLTYDMVRERYSTTMRRLRRELEGLQ